MRGQHASESADRWPVAATAPAHLTWTTVCKADGSARASCIKTAAEMRTGSMRHGARPLRAQHAPAAHLRKGKPGRCASRHERPLRPTICIGVPAGGGRKCSLGSAGRGQRVRVCDRRRGCHVGCGGGIAAAVWCWGLLVLRRRRLVRCCFSFGAGCKIDPYTRFDGDGRLGGPQVRARRVPTGAPGSRKAPPTGSTSRCEICAGSTPTATQDATRFTPRDPIPTCGDARELLRPGGRCLRAAQCKFIQCLPGRTTSTTPGRRVRIKMLPNGGRGVRQLTTMQRPVDENSTRIPTNNGGIAQVCKSSR